MKGIESTGHPLLRTKAPSLLAGLNKTGLFGYKDCSFLIKINGLKLLEILSVLFFSKSQSV